MLIKILFNYIIGYVKISIEGYYIERFINICRKQKITIWNLKRDKSVKLEFNVGISEFKKIVKIAKETKCKVKIMKKKGMPFLFNKYKKRKIFFAFLVLVTLTLVVSSNFIWNVEIIEEKGEKLENIEEDIKNAGLMIGKMKNKIDSKEITNKIRLARKDVSWIGIEIKGTNAVVRVAKATDKPEIIDEEDYCNIVSNKQGVITKISAQNGTVAVNVGDTVNIGTVLINGWMEGKYTGIRYVHAKGNIEAKVWYTAKKEISYKTTERIETGNVENKYKIKFNNFEINFSKRLSKFEIYDTIDTEKKFKIFSDFYMPISLIKTTNTEIEEKEKIYTVDEAKEIGIKELEEELEGKIEDKEKIIDKVVNVNEKENKVEISVTYEVLENIGTNEKIVF